MTLKENIGFVNNSAVIGGCIYYKELYPEVLNASSLYFKGNTAKYFGAKFSSGYPYKLKVLNDFLKNTTAVDFHTTVEINSTTYFNNNKSMFLEDIVII